MPTKPRRHLTVKTNCEYCGTEFDALMTRIREGRGRFCSIKCSNLFRSANTDKKYVGKENACKVFDKTKNSYYVYWIDPETGKRKTTTYPRWWWEVNVGEVPEDYRIGYKDGNPLNIDPDNFYLQSSDEFGSKMSRLLMGHSTSDETKKKIGDKHRGTTLTEEHKQKIGKQSKRLWEEGFFDGIHVGENNWKWRGGIEKRYSTHYSNVIVKDVWQRDNAVCQCCKNDLLEDGKGEVHHVDRNPDNNGMDNLLLLCTDCHQGDHGVHGKGSPLNETIEVLRRMMQ